MNQSNSVGGAHSRANSSHIFPAKSPISRSSHGSRKIFLTSTLYCNALTQTETIGRALRHFAEFSTAFQAVWSDTEFHDQQEMPKCKQKNSSKISNI